MIKVSVIVPIYNSALYLKKCLDSLINQDLFDMEFILINDGSTDDSKEIIKKYNDKRIIYLEQKNLGIGAARNKGIDLASGEYIGFLDSDDYVENNMYSLMYNYAKENNLDIAICDFYNEINNKKNIIKHKNFDITSLNNSPNLLLDIPLGPCNKIYKKKIFDKKSYFPINLKYEDTPFVAYMLSRAKRIGKLNLPLYYYVVHSSSQTTIVDEKVFDIFKICDLIINDVSNKNIKSSVDDLVIYLITKYTISMRYIKNKDFRNNFIDEAFLYLNKNIANFKKSNYFKNRSIVKRIIEKNKSLTKFYCSTYVLLKNVK